MNIASEIYFAENVLHIFLKFFCLIVFFFVCFCNVFCYVFFLQCRSVYEGNSLKKFRCALLI